MHQSAGGPAAAQVPNSRLAVIACGQDAPAVFAELEHVHSSLMLQRCNRGEGKVTPAQHGNQLVRRGAIVWIPPQESTQVGERIGSFPRRNQFVNLLPLEI